MPESVNTNGGFFSTVREKFDSVTSSLGGVVDKGLDTFGNIRGRLVALRLIENDTIQDNQNATIQKKTESSFVPSAKTLLLGTGVAVALFVIFKK